MELGKAAVVLGDVPDKQRDHYREIIDESYTLFDSALMLVINRLKDLLLIAETDKARFANELKRLDNYGEWLRVERDVRLNRPLRATSLEMESIQTKVKDKLSRKDRELLDHLIRIISPERGHSLADLISNSLHDLSNLSSRLDEGSNRSEILKNSEEVAAIDAVRKTRDTLIEVRMRLIQSQLDFYNIMQSPSLRGSSIEEVDTQVAINRQTGFESDLELEDHTAEKLGSLTAADNEKMLLTLEKMYPKSFIAENHHIFLDPRENRQAAVDFQLLLDTSLQTAYLLLAKANSVDSSNEEVISYMKKITQELRMNGRDIIVKARSFFDSVDAIHLVEECDKLLNADYDSSSTT